MPSDTVPDANADATKPEILSMENIAVVTPNSAPLTTVPRKVVTSFHCPLLAVDSPKTLLQKIYIFPRPTKS